MAIGEDISQAFDEQRDQLPTLFTQSNGKIQEIDLALERAKKEREAVRVSKNQLSAEIDLQFQNLAQLLERTRQALLNDLASKVKSKEDALNQQIQCLTHDRYDIFTASRLLQTVSEEQNISRVLLLKKELSEQLTAPSKQKVQVEPVVTANLEFYSDQNVREMIPKHAVVLDGTSPNHCQLAGDGASQATPKMAATFTITAFAAEGKRRTLGGDQFKVEIKGDWQAVPTIQDNKDGSYEVKYVLPHNARGDGKLSVWLQDTLLPGCPKDFKISPFFTFGQKSAGFVVPQAPTPNVVIKNPGQAHEWALGSQVVSTPMEWKTRIDTLENNHWILFGVCLTVPASNDSYSHADTYGIANQNQTYSAGQNIGRQANSYAQGDMILCQLLDDRFVVRNETQNWTENVPIPTGRQWYPLFGLYGSGDGITLQW